MRLAAVDAHEWLTVLYFTQPVKEGAVVQGSAASPSGTVDAGRRRRSCAQPFVANRRSAAIAAAGVGFVQLLRGTPQGREVGPGVGKKGGHLGALEGDRRSLWVVLVIAYGVGRSGHDVVEIALERSDSSRGPLLFVRDAVAQFGAFRLGQASHIPMMHERRGVRVMEEHRAEGFEAQCSSASESVGFVCSARR